MAYKVGKKREDGTVDYIINSLTGKPIEIPTRSTAEIFLKRKGFTEEEINNDIIFEGEDTRVERVEYREVENHPKRKKKYQRRHTYGGYEDDIE